MTDNDAPIKVLFAEDDDRLAALTTRYLRGAGLLVTRVGNGGDALVEAKQRQFDLVLLDLMLPGRNGMDVCRELRSRSLGI